MALSLADAPRSGPSVIARAVQLLGIANIDAVIDGGMSPFIRKDLDISASRPIPVYRPRPEDVASDAPSLSSLECAGWRYVLLQQDGIWLADLVAGRPLRFGELLGGSPAACFAAACRLIDAQNDLVGEVRLLQMPVHGEAALWIAGTTDMFVDLNADVEPAISDIGYLATVRARQKAALENAVNLVPADNESAPPPKPDSNR